MENINGQTQVYGILGNPVTHSLSPLFQNHFLENAGLNARYLPYQVNPEQLEQALHGLYVAHIQGLNITIPHKEATLNLVDADTDAQTIGAVNTLKRTHSGWTATNTDWQGFASVIQGLQIDVSQSPVLLFGAGGTSRAILHALHHQGAQDIFICNRNITRAQSLANALKSMYPNMSIAPLTWNSKTVTPHIQTCQLIINSTSIGLDPQDEFPFPLTGSGFAIDAVYKPHGNTAFCKAASHYTSVDGLPMLIAQGIASFSFWFESELRQALFHLPNNQVALQWVEQQLGRKALSLPGWRT